MSRPALLAFSLGPVQSFISAARTVRDLWAGSYLLSWLTFQGLRPAVENCGRDAVVFPALDGNPLWNWYSASDRRFQDGLLAPCLPNHFLLKVPEEEQARALAGKCEQACRAEWQRLSDAVWRHVSSQAHLLSLETRDQELWQQQIESFFEIRTVVLPCSQGNWATHWSQLGQLRDAARSVRHVPPYDLNYSATDEVPAKCMLLGTYEHVGPGNREAAGEFWEKACREWEYRGTRTRNRERLCAISLVKRFAWPVFFVDHEYRCDPTMLRFSDTATVAARLWLKKVGIDCEEERKQHGVWSGQWLHWQHQEPDADDGEKSVPPSLWDRIRAKRTLPDSGEPPTYYAILMMDGDRMGEKLRQQGAAENHRRISSTLANFALRLAPEIVTSHQGELIYAGGDDVLALLSTPKALACAADLARKFAANWKNAGIKPEEATVSAGIAVVHFKEDLRFALDMARHAEKQAKSKGRNALALTICRRSGEHTTAVCPWSCVPELEKLIDLYLSEKPPSDRWAYKLRAELPTLLGLPPEAATAELQRLLGRVEGEQQKKQLTEIVTAFKKKYHADFKDEPWNQAEQEILGQFATLCQSASFLARGRDE